MIGAGVQVIVNTSGFDDIEQNKVANKGAALLGVAQATEAYIKMAFNTRSPAPAGEPPGIDTGALKNSIIAEPAGSDATVHDAVEYGVHLEFGTYKMAARPWARPGAVWVVHNMPDNIEKQFMGVG